MRIILKDYLQYHLPNTLLQNIVMLYAIILTNDNLQYIIFYWLQLVYNYTHTVADIFIILNIVTYTEFILKSFFFLLVFPYNLHLQSHNFQERLEIENNIIPYMSGGLYFQVLQIRR